MKTRFLIHSLYGNSAKNRKFHDKPNPYGLRLSIRLGNGENLNDLEKLQFRIDSMLKDGWKDLND